MRVARSRWERSVMLTAPAAGEGEATVTVDGVRSRSAAGGEDRSDAAAAAATDGGSARGVGHATGA